jgi:hypothetical protein
MGVKRRGARRSQARGRGRGLAEVAVMDVAGI